MWFLFACTTPAWHGERAVVTVSADHVTFSPTPLGRTGTATVAVENAGGAAADVSVHLVGAFTADRASISIAAGASVDLGLRFTPDDYGTEVGTLQLTTDDGTLLEVSLVAGAAPDSDGDGWDASAAAGEDCDDGDAAVYPGAPDACYDGLDQDCAGNDDDDCDGDGAPIGTDCDDTRADVYDGAAEIVDGVDQDCDGRVDENAVAVDDVLITEIHAAFPAWVELCATHDVALGGWLLDGQALAPTPIPGGGCVIVCERADSGCASTLAFSLNESTDTLSLVGDAPLDTVQWDTRWTATSGRTRSLSADQMSATANDAAASWCVTDGTPGSPNLPC